MPEKKTSTRSRKKSAANDTAAIEKRIIDAAMELAAERPFTELSLADIAERAGLPLAELRRHVCCRDDVLRLLSRRLDEQVLESLSQDPLEGEPVDRLFELIMRRLEQLAPYRAAVRNLLQAAPAIACEFPPVLLRFCTSQDWMLAAAGLKPAGIEKKACMAALATIYLRTLATWVNDDDPGLSKTMAQLDSDLRRAEKAWNKAKTPLKAAQGALDLTGRIACKAAGLLFGLRSTKTAETTETDTTSTASGEGSEASPASP